MLIIKQNIKMFMIIILINNDNDHVKMWVLTYGYIIMIK